MGEPTKDVKDMFACWTFLLGIAVFCFCLISGTSTIIPIWLIIFSILMGLEAQGKWQSLSINLRGKKKVKVPKRYKGIV